MRFEDAAQSSFKHVPLWCLFFGPHQITHQSHIGVRLRKVIE